MTEHTKNREAIVKRLNKIEGQVRGINRMLEEDRYCIDILHQVQATKAALTKVETALLKDHASACVEEALQKGSLDEQREKIVELVGLFERVRA